MLPPLEPSDEPLPDEPLIPPELPLGDPLLLSGLLPELADEPVVPDEPPEALIPPFELFAELCPSPCAELSRSRCELEDPELFF